MKTCVPVTAVSPIAAATCLLAAALLPVRCAKAEATIPDSSRRDRGIIQFEQPEPQQLGQSRESNTECDRQQLQQSLRPLSEIPLDAHPERSNVPTNCHAQLFAEAERGLDYRTRAHLGPPRHYRWKPSGLVHYPAYFDDVAIERYGKGFSPLVQPLVSSARFYADLALLPYQLGVDSPYRKIHTLGYVRPGSPAPCVYEQLPWSCRGALYQAGVVTGARLLFP